MTAEHHDAVAREIAELIERLRAPSPKAAKLIERFSAALNKSREDAERTIETLESNARVQAKLLAETGRERDANHNLAVANGQRAKEEEARAEAAEASNARLQADKARSVAARWDKSLRNKAIEAALSSTPAPAPSGSVAGWKTVPEEPTDKMTFVGQSLRYKSVNSIGAIYREMLAAAPEPPAPSASVDAGMVEQIIHYVEEQIAECDKESDSKRNGVHRAIAMGSALAFRGVLEQLRALPPQSASREGEGK